jgi:hypothetical protein
MQAVGWSDRQPLVFIREQPPLKRSFGDFSIVVL